ncbi:uncharacterized protein LOC131801167 [Musca domestica]|uniref:Uncharacterized protein LOC131801167 n=1 Tax=Musca domestica TaxID=7370 RepID=A0ABM3UP80_MUSDO|nr:uncharacterized protein LOC131801167 [Musca domestica]
MKITLAVLFLAALTIYCKCTTVLSLPPSLIAQAAAVAASLEETPTPKAMEDQQNNAAAAEAATAALNRHNEGRGEGETENAGPPTIAMLNNFQNLWPSKNFPFEKREQKTFEDDIAALAPTQAQQQRLLLQQSMAAIKNNKNAQGQRQQHQQQQYVKGSNKLNEMVSSASNFKHLNVGEGDHDHYQDDDDDGDDEVETIQEQDEENKRGLFPTMPVVDDEDYETTADPEFDSNEWLDPHTAMEKSKSPFPRTFMPDQKPSAVPHKFLTSFAYPTAAAAAGKLPCQTEMENNCLPEDYYHNALNANRDTNFVKSNYVASAPLVSAILQQIQEPNSPMELLDEQKTDADILLLLTAQQNLMQFLNWAMTELYPYGKN